MKRWLKRTLIGVFGASIVMGGLAACGHRHHHGGWQLSEADANKIQLRLLDRASKELTLDDAQKQRLASLAGRLREQRLALLGNTTDPRAQVQALVLQMTAGPTFDRESAQAFVEAKTGALRNKSPEVISAAADFFDSLRPEQQQRVRDLLNKRWGWGQRG
jgi:periplasmic protein CpxP/Spy